MAAFGFSKCGIEEHDESSGFNLSLSLSLALASVSAFTPSLAGAASSDVNRADAVIRCVTIDKEQFCTEIGFTDLKRGSDAWKSYLSAALSAVPSETGDDALLATVVRLESLTASELAAHQRDQIASAKSAVGKGKLYDSIAVGAGATPELLSTYPELAGEGGGTPATTTTGATSLDVAGLTPSAAVAAASPPVSDSIMSGFASEQIYSDYCGPATMQMLGWADSGVKVGQSTWATRLNTTANGTTISNMVGTLNDWTAWDNAAGDYAVRSVSGQSLTWFKAVHTGNIGVFSAPVIEHPVLKKLYFDYLALDHGSHYQVGRGYTNNGQYIMIIEPYDERDFSSAGADTGGYHSVLATSLFNATMANTAHRNIGS